MYLLLSRHHGSLQVGLNRIQIFRNKAPFSGKSFLLFYRQRKNTEESLKRMGLFYFIV